MNFNSVYTIKIHNFAPLNQPLAKTVNVVLEYILNKSLWNR
jgi:hypothetical protein